MRLTVVHLVLVAAVAQASVVDTARELLKRGDHQQAESLLRERIKAAPQDVDARILLGTAFAMSGDRNPAIEQLVEAVRLAPNSATANEALGTVLSRFAEMKAARTAFAKAVELDPKFADARVNLALAMARDGETSGALEQLSAVIAMEGETPASAYPRYLRAKIFSQDKDFVAAATDLEKATALQPNFAEAWSALGLARKVSGDERGALMPLERAATLNPTDARFQYQLGTRYLVAGKPHQAVIVLRRANALNPDDKSTLYSLQRALIQDGQEDEAKRVQAELRQLLQRNETINEFGLAAVELNNDGVKLESAGQLTEALEKYRQALELDPTHDGFRVNYGLALCRLKRWKEGITELKDVVGRNPGNAEFARTLYIAIEQSKAEGAKTDQ